MSRDFLLSQDFNQMLVASFFFHLLFLTIWMFLPQTIPQNEIIVPAFIMSLEEIPGEPEEVLSQPESENKPITEIKTKVSSIRTASIAPKKNKPILESKSTNQPLAKPVTHKARKSELMEELDLLSGDIPPKPILEELDVLLKASVPKKIAPLKKIGPLEKALGELKILKQQIKLPSPKLIEASKSPTQIQEQTIESKTGNSKPILPKPTTEFPEIILPDNLLTGLEELDAEQTTKTPEIALAPESETAGKPLKYLKLSDLSETIISSNAFETKYEDLLKDLDVLQETEIAPQVPTEILPKKKVSGPEMESVSVESSILADKDLLKESIAKITQKIRIPKKAETIEIGINPTYEAPSKKFLSRIRTTKALSNLKPSRGIGPTGGSSNPLALYIGEVKLKIDSNWEIPLGTQHQREILVTFFIFSEGNIEKPRLIASSGDDQLDAMAIKAILDSSPFPKFSKKLTDYLKEPNLNINMRFKLTSYEKNN